MKSSSAGAKRRAVAGSGTGLSTVVMLRWTARKAWLSLSKALLVERRTTRLKYSEEFAE